MERPVEVGKLRYNARIIMNKRGEESRVGGGVAGCNDGVDVRLFRHHLGP